MITKFSCSSCHLVPQIICFPLYSNSLRATNNIVIPRTVILSAVNLSVCHKVDTQMGPEGMGDDENHLEKLSNCHSPSQRAVGG